MLFLTSTASFADWGVEVRASGFQQNSATIGQLEVRPQLKGQTQNEMWSFSVEPRAFVTTAEDLDERLFFREAFGRATWRGHFLKVGKQFVRWGPSPLLNPSNVFQLEITPIPPFAEHEGQELAQAQIFISESASAMAMFLPNDEGFLLKADHFWDGGASLLGLTYAGRDQKDRRREEFVGAFGAWTLNSAWQVYFDGVQGLRTDYLYPRSTFTLSDRRDHRPFFRGLVDVGVRRTLENGFEIRLEYIYHGFGFTDQEVQSYQQMAVLPLPAGISLSRLRRDLALTRQNYGVVLLQHQWADSGWVYLRQPIGYLRWLTNLDDQGSLGVLSMEAGLSDHWSAEMFLAKALGPENTEARSGLNELYGVGVKWSY